MTSIKYDYLKKLQKWGMNLTPMQSNKHPENVNGHHFYGWSLRELAKKERIGVFHKSGFYDIDFDDEKYNYLRKKTLDLGNDILRELENNLEMFEIRIK